MFQLVILDMACHELSHGWPYYCIVFLQFFDFISSAEVVAKMIVAELVGEKWTTPEWLPERYLTWVRDGESPTPLPPSDPWAVATLEFDLMDNLEAEPSRSVKRSSTAPCDAFGLIL